MVCLELEDDMYHLKSSRSAAVEVWHIERGKCWSKLSTTSFFFFLPIMLDQFRITIQLLKSMKTFKKPLFCILNIPRNCMQSVDCMYAGRKARATLASTMSAVFEDPSPKPTRRKIIMHLPNCYAETICSVVIESIA